MRRISVACATAAAACALPMTASAATLVSDKPCYLEGENASLAGEGYAPGGAVTFAFDGTPAGQGTADAAGRVLAGFTAPTSIGAVSVREYSVSASDEAGNTGATSLAVTKREVEVNPSSGSPRRRVRFSIRGMVPGRALYAHYVLRGRERARVRFGRVGGPCGTLVKRARFFPQRNVQRGSWTIQFDHRRRYSRRTTPRVRYAVRVFRVFGRTAASWSVMR